MWLNGDVMTNESLKSQPGVGNISCWGKSCWSGSRFYKNWWQQKLLNHMWINTQYLWCSFTVRMLDILRGFAIRLVNVRPVHSITLVHVSNAVEVINQSKKEGKDQESIHTWPGIPMRIVTNSQLDFTNESQFCFCLVWYLTTHEPLWVISNRRY